MRTHQGRRVFYLMKNNKNGYVYFIKHKGLNPIKIGSTISYTPYNRISNYNTYSPYGIELLGYIESDNAIELESKLLKYFVDKRLNGEWFDISINDIQSIIEIYKINGINFLENNSYNNKLKKFLNSMPKKIYNKDLLIFYNDFFKTKKDIKSILKEIKYSNIEFKKGKDNNGRFLNIL